jgi:hypothetical protein
MRSQASSQLLPSGKAVVLTTPTDAPELDEEQARSLTVLLLDVAVGKRDAVRRV